MAEAVAKQGSRKGDFLGGKYLLGDCLGIGGMGEVYRAQNVSLGRQVAIKILSAEFVKNEDDEKRFLREARAAAAVRHPNVVDVLDVARDDDGTPFIVQELLSGQDLEQHLQAQGGRMTALEVLEVMIPVADAVGAAHRQGVVHRDLKPANIFLARDGTRIVPKVLDFGAALYKTVGGLSAKEQRMLIGTPHYMAPEQITTKTDVDARADVWALGIILYELLVGETPFEAETADAVLKLVRTRSVPPLREGAPKAPPELERLVAQCTQREKSKRLADANVVREELVAVRDTLKQGTRKRPETVAEKGDSEPPPASSRVPSLVVAPPKTPTKRRGSALLTLSTPDSEPPPSSRGKRNRAAALEREEPPASVERPIEAARPELDDPFGDEKRPKSPPPSPPSDTKRDVGARNLMEMEDFGGPLELQIEKSTVAATPQSEPPKKPGSLPPVLDPRSVARAGPGSIRPPKDETVSASPRPVRVDTGGSAFTPPLAPRARHSAEPEEIPPLATKAKLALGGTVIGPAIVLFAVFEALAFLTAPLGRAMRGETPIGSGVFAVVALVSAAALGLKAVSARSRGLNVSAIGAVLLGIVMIIVTFGASETLETGVAPPAASLVPFVAPLAPLGLMLSALRRAREHWGMRYDRREAVTWALVAAFLFFVLLELSPLGVFRHVR